MLCRLSYVRMSGSRLSLLPHLYTPGWIRTSDTRRRRTGLCPLSYGRMCVKSPRQDSNPHPGRTKGVCLPLTLRRRDGDGGSRTPLLLGASEAFFQKNLIPEGVGCAVRTGGVEPPQSVTRGYSAVSSPRARRPRVKAGGGACFPQPEAETLLLWWTPEPAVAHRPPASALSAPLPPHRSALEACRSQLHGWGRAHHSPVPSLTSARPSASRSLASSAGGIRTHGLELMRLARTTAPLPRSRPGGAPPGGAAAGSSGGDRSGWLESNQRSPVPETGGVARLPHSQMIKSTTVESNHA